MSRTTAIGVLVLSLLAAYLDGNPLFFCIGFFCIFWIAWKGGKEHSS